MHYTAALSEYTLSMPVEIGPLKFCRQEIENIIFSTRFSAQIDKFVTLEDSKKNERPKVPLMLKHRDCSTTLAACARLISGVGEWG